MAREPTHNERLILRAAQLARSNPAAWSDFVKCLEHMSDHATTQLIQSPPETLQSAQGRARAFADILKSLEDCVTRADRIQK